MELYPYRPATRRPGVITCDCDSDAVGPRPPPLLDARNDLFGREQEATVRNQCTKFKGQIAQQRNQPTAPWLARASGSNHWSFFPLSTCGTHARLQNVPG